MRVKEGQFHHHTTKGMGRYCLLVVVLICVVLLIGYALYYMQSTRVPIAHHSMLRPPEIAAEQPHRRQGTPSY